MQTAGIRTPPLCSQAGPSEGIASPPGDPFTASGDRSISLGPRWATSLDPGQHRFGRPDRPLLGAVGVVELAEGARTIVPDDRTAQPSPRQDPQRRAMTVRTRAAVLAVASVNALSRRLGRGSGTVAGGRIGLMVAPKLLSVLGEGRTNA